MDNLRKVIRGLLNEDYQSFRELQSFINDILKSLAEVNLKVVIDYAQGVKLSQKMGTQPDELEFYSVNIRDAYADSGKKYPKLEDFINNSNVSIYLEPNKSSVNIKGSYRYGKNDDSDTDRTYDNSEGKDVVVKYDNGLVETILARIEKLGARIDSQDLYFMFSYPPFKSTMLHELQHAYDDFRSGGKVFKSKQSAEYIMAKEKEDKENEMEVYVKYLRMPHEVWARFSQAIDKTRFTDGQWGQKPNGEHYMKAVMVPLDIVVEKFKNSFLGWHELGDDGKMSDIQKKLMSKVVQFWHHEQERIKSENVVNESTLRKKIRSVLLEYISNDVVYLKKYLNMSDEDKKSDLAYHYCYEFDDFLSYHEDEVLEKISEEEYSQLMSDARDDSCNALESCETKYPEVFQMFINIVEGHIDDEDAPAYRHMDYRQLVKNQWLIHFTGNAYAIVKDGFTIGESEIEQLAYTTSKSMSAKKGGGYNFAFLLNDFERYGRGERGVGKYKYGKEAVIFRASGIKVWHYGDAEPQVIFYGNTARNINAIYNDGGDWHIDSNRDGRVLYKNESLDSVVDWFRSNYEQYRKVLN